MNLNIKIASFEIVFTGAWMVGPAAQFVMPEISTTVIIN